MQNPGETPIEHGDWISQARHRVAALAGRAVRFVFGESAPAPELYDPEYDYSTRQEALRTLGLLHFRKKLPRRGMRGIWENWQMQWGRRPFLQLLRQRMKYFGRITVEE